MRLAIVLSHPIQYYSPWFRLLAKRDGLELRVYYLWESGVVQTKDRGFGKTFAWDIPLLEEYDFEFVPNRSKNPGTHHAAGLDNPTIVDSMLQWDPEAILLFGYAWKTHLRVLFSRQLRKIPKLFRGDSHDLCPQRGPRAAAARWLKKRIIRRFSHYLPVGKANQDFLKGLGVSEHRLTIVPHCVDNERFQTSFEDRISAAKPWKEEHGIDPDRPVILFVGKLEPKKRPLDLLEAFLSASFLPEARNPVLVFVGDGELRKPLEDRAADQVEKQVYFVSFQNQSAMPQVYAAGDVLVLPSVGSGETWGLVVNEAMNLGTPAIVSSHVGCGPDLVLPGETGWRFEAGNVNALRSCLEEAMRDPERLERMGTRAREHVCGYSYEVAARELSIALEKVSLR